MSPPKTLVDTDTLSLLARSQQRVVQRATDYLAFHGRLSLSLMTRYEILRGLLAKSAQTQIAAFRLLCSKSEITPISEPIVNRAAAIYADLHRRGNLIGDADILIAATAMEHGLVLATNNVAHFSRISGLIVDNWQA